MTCEQASQWLRFFQRRFTVLSDRPELLTCWHALVNSLRISGLRSYDARLVAAMQTYGISRLLTFDADDFKVFSIAIVDPASLSL
jgi:predicted nucleic acid-binding protein